MIQQSEHYIKLIEQLNDDARLSEISHEYMHNLVQWRKDILIITDAVENMRKEGLVEAVELESYVSERIEVSVKTLLGHDIYITIGHANDYYIEKYMISVSLKSNNVTCHTDDINLVLRMLDNFNYLYVKSASDFIFFDMQESWDKFYERRQELKNGIS